MPLNIEIKARCANLDRIRSLLADKNAEFKGTDHQVDTYFKVHGGRLKLREGFIENALIFYKRPDLDGPKISEVTLFPTENPGLLKPLLAEALGVGVIVDKIREIYFIDNVKFHLDEVKDLGKFVEIEAIDQEGILGIPKIDAQCAYFKEYLGIEEEDLVTVSYSDLLLARR